MPILCRHVQVYTLGRLSIDGFSFERVAQFNLEWIFSKLDSGFQSLVGFRILSAGFRIPKPWILDSTSKKFLDSGIRIPLHGAKRHYHRVDMVAVPVIRRQLAATGPGWYEHSNRSFWK